MINSGYVLGSEDGAGSIEGAGGIFERHDSVGIVQICLLCKQQIFALNGDLDRQYYYHLRVHELENKLSYKASAKKEAQGSAVCSCFRGKAVGVEGRDGSCNLCQPQ
jgi:hypothetical protein